MCRPKVGVLVALPCSPFLQTGPCPAALRYVNIALTHTHLPLLLNKGQGGEIKDGQTVAGSTREMSTKETEKKRSRVWTQRREEETRTPEDLDAPVSFAPFLLVGYPIANLVPELVQIRTAPIGKEGRIAFVRQYRRRRGRADKTRRLLCSSMSSQFSFAYNSR